MSWCACDKLTSVYRVSFVGTSNLGGKLFQNCIEQLQKQNKLPIKRITMNIFQITRFLLTLVLFNNWITVYTPFKIVFNCYNCYNICGNVARAKVFLL